VAAPTGSPTRRRRWPATPHLVIWSTTASLLPGETAMRLSVGSGRPGCQARDQPQRGPRWRRISSGRFGITHGRKRWTISPPERSGTFSKFHWMSPGVAVGIGNDTKTPRRRDGGAVAVYFHLLEHGEMTAIGGGAEVAISSDEPGSCSRTGCTGNRRTVKPRSTVGLLEAFEPSYWGSARTSRPR